MKPLLTLHPLTKTCTMCKQNKPVEENFYKRYDHDSFYSKCKLCLNSIPRNPREAYFKKPKIKAKNKSRHALTYAVRVGKMVRQPCVKCGNKKTEGHHEDYSKPYDVIWLCRACHSKEHRMLRAKEKKMKLTILLLSLCLIGLSGSALASPERIVDRETAIQTILLEARGESLEGQIAVGEVIRTRSRERNKTVQAVCFERLQFSCWNDKTVARKALIGITGEEYQEASKAWELSEGSNLTMGANHYLNKRKVKKLPKWAKVSLETVTISNHTFYRL